MLYNKILNLFSENNLICSNHSGFRLGASYINQLLSISHETFSAFEIGLEIWGLFLNISNGFDKVWHVSLIHKLHQNDTCGSMVNIWSDFLINRKQRVVLYRVFFSWVDIRGEVPQDFMLGAFLLLIYANNFWKGIKNELIFIFCSSWRQ